MSRYTGIINNGNTCFINAIIQMLYRIPNFKNGKHLLNRFFTSMKEEEIKDLSLPKEANLGLSSNATEFECPLNTNKNRIGKRRQQQDAAEFLLNSILNKVDTDLLKILAFSLQTESYCRSKGKDILKEEGNPESQLILPLQLTETTTTVQKSLDEYLKEETLGESLDRCKGGDSTSHKVMKLISDRTQDYLLVQLGRFSLEQKLETPVSLDTTLRVANSQWDLEGIVLHSGSLESGHYRYLWKDPLQMWFLFDDSTVEDKDKNYLETESVKKDSYILLYKRNAVAVTKPKSSFGRLLNFGRTQTRKARNSLGKLSTSAKSSFGKLSASASSLRKKAGDSFGKLSRSTRTLKKKLGDSMKEIFNPNTSLRKKRRIKENSLRKTQKGKKYSKTFVAEILKNPKPRKTYKNKKYTQDPLIKELVYDVLDT